MKIKNRLDNYLYDSEYKIIIKKDSIDIINYDEIIDFSLNKISVRHQNKIITIEGSNLSISKLVIDEVLIIGNISNINIK